MCLYLCVCVCLCVCGGGTYNHSLLSSKKKEAGILTLESFCLSFLSSGVMYTVARILSYNFRPPLYLSCLLSQPVPLLWANLILKDDLIQVCLFVCLLKCRLSHKSRTSQYLTQCWWCQGPHCDLIVCLKSLYALYPFLLLPHSQLPIISTVTQGYFQSKQAHLKYSSGLTEPGVNRWLTFHPDVPTTSYSWA